ncbi:NAD(P)H-hydrate dehydratase [Oxynema sp. CENA135]|uniref:NAD(P)H-hydrate dehydratase n=1 Tax=Oxynema sp. CENA135 TaxID=984206 RepID=UPI001F3EAA25|nr:NAD(P)H-hydrate dehydratase [Oxynema sp. CENA135]
MMTRTDRRKVTVESILVTAEQMRAIEARVFEAGMPVAALMEKVAGSVARRIEALLQQMPEVSRVGVLVGPGHNGGDALVVARELHFQGYAISVYQPLSKLKALTSQHAQYLASLGVPFDEEISALEGCDVFIDGLFGFGLERPLSGAIAEAVDRLNEWDSPVLSIDLPSGLQTDTGQPLGTAVRATRTFCLGLWKLGLVQDEALAYVGTPELIDFDLPLADIEAVVNRPPALRRIVGNCARSQLPLDRPQVTHKYKQGHLLLVASSRRYSGAGLLAGLAARASGVGMLSIAVPESLKLLYNGQLPEALVVGCPETETGAIAAFPDELDLQGFSAIACGPGLTLDAAVVPAILDCPVPAVLDADGLNWLAQNGTVERLSAREAPTILTPHPGEFKRLFPEIERTAMQRCDRVRQAAVTTGAIVVLKGARTAIAHPDGTVAFLPESTPALARGGTGDVLTGLLGGLVAQGSVGEGAIAPLVEAAVWWHAQAGRLAARERSELGVDARTLTDYLIASIVDL